MNQTPVISEDQVCTKHHFQLRLHAESHCGSQQLSWPITGWKEGFLLHIFHLSTSSMSHSQSLPVLASSANPSYGCGWCIKQCRVTDSERPAVKQLPNVLLSRLLQRFQLNVHFTELLLQSAKLCNTLRHFIATLLNVPTCNTLELHNGNRSM